MSDNKIVSLQQRREQVKSEQQKKDEEEIKESLLNPTIEFGDWVMKMENDGSLVNLFYRGKFMEKRKPTNMEMLLLIHSGMCEKAILLLMENYEPAKIQWTLAPHQSVDWDRLTQRRDDMKNGDGNECW